MRYYHWMLLAPFPAWIAWGVALNLYPQYRFEWFPIFWTLSDLAIFTALLGLMLWVRNSGSDARPERRRSPAGRDDSKGAN